MINFHARKWFLRVLENSLGPFYYSNTLEKRCDILNQQTKRNQTRKTFNGATITFFRNRDDFGHENLSFYTV